MAQHLDTVTPDISVDTFVRDHLMRSEQRAFPVLEDGRLDGLIRRSDLMNWASLHVPREEKERRRFARGRCLRSMRSSTVFSWSRICGVNKEGRP